MRSRRENVSWDFISFWLSLFELRSVLIATDVAARGLDIKGHHCLEYFWYTLILLDPQESQWWSTTTVRIAQKIMCTGPLSLTRFLVLCPSQVSVSCFLTVNHTVFVHYGDSIAIAKFLSREVSDKQDLLSPGLDELVVRARKAIALPSSRNQAKICLSSDICCLNLDEINYVSFRWGCLESYRHCRSHEESRFSCASRNAAGGTELCTFWVELNHFHLENHFCKFGFEVVDQMLWRRQKSQQNDNRWDHLPKVPRPVIGLWVICKLMHSMHSGQKVSAGQFLFLIFTQVLMVAEKPSVAKLIAEFLSGGRMRFRKGQQRILRMTFWSWLCGLWMTWVNIFINFCLWLGEAKAELFRSTSLMPIFHQLISNAESCKPPRSVMFLATCLLDCGRFIGCLLV